MVKDIKTRVIRYRVKQDQWGHDIAIPCLVRAYVGRDDGKIIIFSGTSELEAKSLARKYLRGKRGK